MLAEGSTQDKMKTRSAPADQRGFLCDFSFVIMNKSKAKSPLCDERDNMCVWPWQIRYSASLKN